MSKNKLKISVCIPAYNRPEFLVPLLDSISSQDYTNYEIVICEDSSPLRKQIKDIVLKYSLTFPGEINYYENKSNLGYDGNIRNLISKAKGEYCFCFINSVILLPRSSCFLEASSKSEAN